jgi:predicted RNA binding protein YcfA (HicA-like mRNA interferase family)
VKLPRDIKGTELVRALREFGYAVTRQVGSHVRLSTEHGGGHRLTVPLHRDIRVGTLDLILEQVAEHFGLTRAEVQVRLFA